MLAHLSRHELGITASDLSCWDQFIAMALAQHNGRESLRDIKSVYGTSANAVKIQVWVAIIVYLLVAITKKRLKLQPSLHTLLQIVGVNLFEKTDVIQLVKKALRQEIMAETDKQVKLLGS